MPKNPFLSVDICNGCRFTRSFDRFGMSTAGRAWPYQEALHARVGFYLVAFSLVFVFILVLFDLSW